MRRPGIVLIGAMTVVLTIAANPGRSYAKVLAARANPTCTASAKLLGDSAMIWVTLATLVDIFRLLVRDRVQSHRPEICRGNPQPQVSLIISSIIRDASAYFPKKEETGRGEGQSGTGFYPVVAPDNLIKYPLQSTRYFF